MKKFVCFAALISMCGFVNAQCSQIVSDCGSMSAPVAECEAAPVAEACSQQAVAQRVQVVRSAPVRTFAANRRVRVLNRFSTIRGASCSGSQAVSSCSGSQAISACQ